jgi:LPXTG-site transpeptidase (sortase) family protein
MINRWLWITFSLLVVCIVIRGYIFYLDKTNADERELLTEQFQQLMQQLQSEAATGDPQSTLVPIVTIDPNSGNEVTVIPNYQSDETKQKLLQQLGNQVVGEIEIPKIGLKYIILDQATEKNLKISITKFYGPPLNKPGNVVLTGHNMWNGSHFGLLKLLEKGDTVKLVDMQGMSKTYSIIDREIVREDNLSPLYKYGEDGTYVTLITCDTDDTFRLVYYAKMDDVN